MKERLIWYIVCRNEEDRDMGIGSLDLKDAIQTARELGGDAFIKVIDDTDETTCIDEIHSEDFYKYE